MGFPPQAWFLEAAGWDDGSLPIIASGYSGGRILSISGSGRNRISGDRAGEQCAETDCSSRAGWSRTHLPGEELTEKEEYTNGVDTAWKKSLTDGKGAWIELEEAHSGEDLYQKGVNIGFETGDAVGKVLMLGDIQENVLP